MCPAAHGVLFFSKTGGVTLLICPTPSFGSISTIKSILASCALPRSPALTCHRWIFFWNTTWVIVRLNRLFLSTKFRQCGIMDLPKKWVFSLSFEKIFEFLEIFISIFLSFWRKKLKFWKRTYFLSKKHKVLPIEQANVTKI